MSLSVCLVTRNEEMSIERALRSVAGVADELIVADTGSADRTATIASQLGAKVGQHAWQDDFAAARNHALSMAGCDWILWLNPDEELLPVSRGLLPFWLGRNDALAYMVGVQDLLKAERPDYFTYTNQPRLFRRDSGARYLGRLHPYFDPGLPIIARQKGMAVFSDSTAVIRRHAYLSTLTADKLRWAARLLELELRDRPGQLHFLIEYGRTLLWLNDPKGHLLLAEAVEQVLPIRDLPVAPNPKVGSLLEYLLSVSPEQSKSRISRDEARQLALQWFRQTPPVVWALAQERFLADDYPGAAAYLEDLLRMGTTRIFDQSMGFEPDILGAYALLNLGICHVRLNDLDKARNCFGQLVNHPVHQGQARQGMAMVEAQRGQPSR